MTATAARMFFKSLVIFISLIINLLVFFIGMFSRSAHHKNMSQNYKDNSTPNNPRRDPQRFATRATQGQNKEE